MIEYTETIKKTIDFYNKHHKQPVDCEPFKSFCKETDCCISQDGTCEMIRKYLDKHHKEPEKSCESCNEILDIYCTLKQNYPETQLCKNWKSQRRSNED